MEEVFIKTHLIIKSIHDEFEMNWCGKLIDTKPRFKNGQPVFIIIGSKGRMEVNTISMEHLEHCAKMMTEPKGRSAITTDVSRIYIKEIDGKETLLGVLTHRNVKKYAPMYDSFGYK